MVTGDRDVLRLSDDDDSAETRLRALRRAERIVTELHRPRTDEEPGTILLTLLLRELEAAAACLTARAEGGQTEVQAKRGLPPALCDRLAEELPPLRQSSEWLDLAAAPLSPELTGALREIGLHGLIRLPLKLSNGQTELLLLLDHAPSHSPAGGEALELIARHLALALTNQQRQQELLRALPPQLSSLHPEVVDPLTGLYNSQYFHTLLEAEVERARRYGGRLSLLLLDIDDLKEFNRDHGHEEGDRLLRRVAEVLRSVLRKIDTACRYGGEEFVAILPGCGDAALQRLAERVRSELCDRPFVLADGRETRVTVSIGAACYDQTQSLESFIRLLDVALERAKRHGKNCISIPGGS